MASAAAAAAAAAAAPAADADAGAATAVSNCGLGAATAQAAAAGTAKEGARDEAQAEQPAEGSWKRLKLRAGTLRVQSSERWEANLAALKAYAEESDGRLPNRSSACVEERQLGYWYERQREMQRGTNHDRGALSTAQERQLQQVRGWTWSRAAAQPAADAAEEPAMGGLGADGGAGEGAASSPRRAFRTCCAA